MFELINKGKTAGFGTAFAVMKDGIKVGMAYRAESGKRRGMYQYGSLRDGGFTGSRARLMQHLASV